MDAKYKNLPWALAKELSQAQSRPSWESRNEGIHERISFDDTIWGFNLAGGAYYETPLRVTQVKENSRADKAGIKVGDVLRFINDVDTSLLTLQEAHDIILQSGIEIKLKLSAPDVEEPYHYTYEDEILEKLREMKRKRDKDSKQKRKPFTGAKTNSQWSCVWPCNKKRDVTYRESNCFLIPSKHEEKMRLKREREKLEEDRAAEQMHKEKNISMMKTQNAFNMMESDEEIEPQYFELLEKKREENNHIEKDTGERREPKYNIKSELSEALYVPEKHSEINRDEDKELSSQNNAGIIENCTEDTKFLKEINDSNFESNEIFLSNNNTTPADHNGEIENDNCEDKDIFNEKENNILGENINNLSFINGDLSKMESENAESEPENENCSDDQEIELQNRIILNGEDETQLSDEKCSIPSDDDDLFHEELVILNESETDSLSDDNNEELVIDLNQRDRYQEKDETT